MNISLRFSLSVALAMLFVFVTGDYLIDRYQLMLSAHGERTASFAEAPKTSPSTTHKLKFDRLVENVARTYGLDSALLYAVILVESGANPNRVSKKGASGLMQLMPNTAKYYGVIDPFDPVQNLHGGAKYLRDMMILFDGDVSLAVAAYNAGETAVVRYGNQIPPYAETMNYVSRVLNLYREYQENPPRSSDVMIANGFVAPKNL